MKVCIDPGHGMGNRHASVYDSGATHKEEGVPFEEAKIALDYSKCLGEIFIGRGHQVMLTRDSPLQSCPLRKRAPRAEAWGADMFLSIHLNDVDSDLAHGVEVWYRDYDDRSLAEAVQHGLVSITGFADRGAKRSDELSVLHFRGPAILIELGFIANDGDRNFLLDVDNRDAICRMIAKTVIEWREAQRKR